MERYCVTNVTADGYETRLIVPYPPTAPLADFKAEISKRLAKYKISIPKAELQLRLGSSNGPFLDDDDTLQAVILNPRDEVLYAVTGGPVSSSRGKGAALTNVREANSASF